jgi:hypothetical protein
VKRHARIAQVIGKPSASGEKRFLHDIAGVEPSGHARIQSATHHAMERFAVTIHQSIHGFAIAMLGAAQQIDRFILIGPHD